MCLKLEVMMLIIMFLKLEVMMLIIMFQPERVDGDHCVSAWMCCGNGK